MERVNNILVSSVPPSDRRAIWIYQNKIFKYIDGEWKNIGGGGIPENTQPMTVNAIKLTQEEYDSLAEKQENVLYIISN